MSEPKAEIMAEVEQEHQDGDVRVIDSVRLLGVTVPRDEAPTP